jgi:hypothetical protein
MKTLNKQKKRNRRGCFMDEEHRCRNMSKTTMQRVAARKKKEKKSVGSLIEFVIFLNLLPRRKREKKKCSAFHRYAATERR